MFRNRPHARISVALPLLLLFAGLVVSCSDDSAEDTDITEKTVRGVYLGSQFDGRVAVIHHETIPGIMEAMKMGFKVIDSEELAVFEGGEKISFQLIMDGEDWSIKNLQRLSDTLQLALPDSVQ